MNRRSRLWFPRSVRITWYFYFGVAACGFLGRVAFRHFDQNPLVWDCLWMALGLWAMSCGVWTWRLQEADHCLMVTVWSGLAICLVMIGLHDIVIRQVVENPHDILWRCLERGVAVFHRIGALVLIGSLGWGLWTLKKTSEAPSAKH